MTEPKGERDEIQRLMQVADRELHDAATPGLSHDGSFEHAYTAALALATVIVRAEDQRVHGPDHHRRTFELLASVRRGRWSKLAGYLQHCRARRNQAVYDEPGVASEAEARELREAVVTFRSEVTAFLKETHPDLA